MLCATRQEPEDLMFCDEKARNPADPVFRDARTRNPAVTEMPAEQFAGNGCRFYFGDASKRSAILALLVATVLCFSLSLSLSLSLFLITILIFGIPSGYGFSSSSSSPNVHALR